MTTQCLATASWATCLRTVGWCANGCIGTRGAIIYWPNGETLPLARIHNEPEQAVAVAHMRIREELGETPCPTTVTTTV